eukprot:Nitzschia sp. Nitz4//scaffold317_size20466//16181//18064//NITZ4_008667-RA/size20466-processed-gene-0.12-mRNA-1//1//CDS//3329547548//2965//frame0
MEEFVQGLRERTASEGSLPRSVGTHSRRSSNSSDRRLSSRRVSKRKKATAAAAAMELSQQQDRDKELASLQLPHMPASLFSDPPSVDEPPTMRILVVADIDLESASALAETALASSNPDNPLRHVDLCIACGPFCQEDDLRKYYQGRQRRRHMARHHTPPCTQRSHSNTYHQPSSSSSQPYPTYVPQQYASSHLSGQGRAASSTSRHASSTHAKHASGNHGGHSNSRATHPTSSQQYPSKRTREETAALEGLVTAALSQLESIVCRVVFVPGKSDPLTTITSTASGGISYTRERRLTPNSRNIHQHWMPLSPGLGCAGLLYLDAQRLQQQPPPLEDDDDDDDDDDSVTSSIPEDASESFTQEDGNTSASGHNNMPPLTSATFDERAKEYGSEFCEHLQELVELAPSLSSVSDTLPTHAQITNLLKTKRFQSILVTHFHHLENDAATRSMHHSQSNASQQSHPSLNAMDPGMLLMLDEEEEEESFDPPWPTEHEAFCARPMVQEHVLLEIAAGRNSKGESVRPMELPKGPAMRVILPGSLRERGEFCLVDVAFESGLRDEDFRWRVRRTQFETLDEFLL